MRGESLDGRCLKGITNKFLASRNVQAKKSLNVNVRRVVAAESTELDVFLLQATTLFLCFLI